MTSNIFVCFFQQILQQVQGFRQGFQDLDPSSDSVMTDLERQILGGPELFEFFWWTILIGVKRNYTLIFLMFILNSLLRSLIFERDPRTKIGIELYQRKSGIPHGCWDWNPEGIGGND